MFKITGKLPIIECPSFDFSFIFLEALQIQIVFTISNIRIDLSFYYTINLHSRVISQVTTSNPKSMVKLRDYLTPPLASKLIRQLFSLFPLANVFNLLQFSSIEIRFICAIEAAVAASVMLWKITKLSQINLKCDLKRKTSSFLSFSPVRSLAYVFGIVCESNYISNEVTSQSQEWRDMWKELKRWENSFDIENLIHWL